MRCCKKREESSSAFRVYQKEIVSICSSPVQSLLYCVWCIQKLAERSVHGGGGGHQAAVHAGRGPASVSWGSLLWGHHQDQCPAGHDEDGWLYSCLASALLLLTNVNISSLDPQLVSCNVSSYQHTSVSLEFFETVVRYDKFFIVEPQHIPVVLVSFCVHLSHV